MFLQAVPLLVLRLIKESHIKRGGKQKTEGITKKENMNFAKGLCFDS